MSWIDWLVTLLPVAFVLFMALYVRRYIRGVADYLAAGRLCGRYVLCVSDLSNALAVVTLVAYVEVHYKTGFALAFWQSLAMPIGVVMSLTGFCIYRFRETRAMSLGQFLEMRYSRPFRIFAAALRSVTEVFTNMIMPAVAARFFICFLGLPETFLLFGWEVSTFQAVILVCLVCAIGIIYAGGILSILVTDVIQGMMCFPLVVIFIVFLLVRFSWSGEIVPVLEDRVIGESFVNPYDVGRLRDFNLFMVSVSLLALIMHKASWIGSGESSSAKTPHEQKMAGILGTWRGAFHSLFYVIIGVAVITGMHHKNFADYARSVRIGVSERAVRELVRDPVRQATVMRDIRAIPANRHTVGQDAPFSQKSNPDTPYFEAANRTFQTMPKGNALLRQFKTHFHQLMLPEAMRRMLPAGLLGLFCLMMVIFMISSDDSRIYSACVTITQDCVLPFCPKGLSPKQHIRILRLVSVGVGIVFFLGSSKMAQLDYIQLFTTIVCSMWLGGCGPVMLFGLYSRFGTTAGAFASLVSGMVLSAGGILIQRNWPDYVYPWLADHGWVAPLDGFLRTVSAPFHPVVSWKMDPVDFPVNAYEIYFLTMLISLVLYCAVSWATRKEPFNLDRMLHRGIYAPEGEKRVAEPFRWSKIGRKLIGITPEYTRGDRIIAWSVFGYSIVYKFLIAFVLVVVCNSIFRWPVRWWSTYFFFVFLVIPGIAAAVSTVWFSIGGFRDLRQMFRDLKTRVDDPLDNGMVEGHVSLADAAAFRAAEEQRKK